MNILLFGSTASNICSGLSPALKILGLVFVALRVAVPIILIVVALFGFVAAIASKDDSNVKESMQKVLTKATSAIAIFLVFTIVKTVVNIVSPASEDNCTACIFDISKCTNLEFRKNTGINIGGSSSDGGSTPSVVNGLRINSVIQKNSIITIKASSTEDTVVGYYISKTNSKPSLEDDKWVNKSANTLKVARMPGTYYVFVKDSIGNIAGGKKVSVKLSEILAPKSRTEKNC